MASLLNNVKIYAEKWTKELEEPMDEEDKKAIESGVVVDSQYGKSVCFTLKAGGQAYISLSKDSNLLVGDPVDINKATVITLTKTGEDPIFKIGAYK